MTDPGDESDLDRVAAAVLAVPSVVRLTSGLGAAATFLPGRRIDGLRMTPDELEVHIVARYGVNLPDLAAEVRARVQGIVGGRVSVFVEDVELPQPEPALPAGGEGPAGGPA
jgi:uncharacterized alkaline shock family protein YloU